MHLKRERFKGAMDDKVDKLIVTGSRMKQCSFTFTVTVVGGEHPSTVPLCSSSLVRSE